MSRMLATVACSPSTVRAAAHTRSRSRQGRAVTRSAKGMASWPVIRVKIANSDPSPWSSASSALSIRSTVPAAFSPRRAGSLLRLRPVAVG